MTYLQIMML